MGSLGIRSILFRWLVILRLKALTEVKGYLPLDVSVEELKTSVPEL